jgi:ribonuclease I
MNPKSRRVTWAVLAIAAIGAPVAWFSQRDSADSPPVGVEKAQKPAPAAAPASTGFDFYLMALTVHPAFCTDGHARQRECQARGQRPLVIHGLWPERNEPRTYPHDCPAPPLDLEPALALELADFMPGVAEGLDEHEWREHGGCSGLDDDVYYRHALKLARGVDAALAARLTTLAGEETSAGALREVADAFSPGLSASLTFHCRTLRDAPAAQRGQPFLIEVRQCVDNDGPGGAPGTPLDCAAVKRRDQGCGRSFRIAGVPR